MSTESTEALIERVLAEHAAWPYRCNCGWRPLGFAPHHHRRHVAGFIARALTEATR